MFNDKPQPTKFDANDPEKQFPVGCACVFDANGECLSPVVSCDTATGEVTRYVMTRDGKFVIGEDYKLATVTEVRAAPLRIEVRPIDAESQYQLAKSVWDGFAMRKATPREVAEQLVNAFENGGVLDLSNVADGAAASRRLFYKKAAFRGPNEKDQSPGE